MASSGQYYTSQRLVVAGEQPFLWWRLVGVLLVLAFIGWGFNSSFFCHPAPSKSHQIIFCVLLSLIFLETVQAGWYRGHHPTELRVLEFGKRVAKWSLYLLVCLFALWAILTGLPLLLDSLGSLEDSAKLWFGLAIFLFVIVIALIYMAYDSDNL